MIRCFFRLIVRLASAQAQDAARQSAQALAAKEAASKAQKEEIERLHVLIQKAAHSEHDLPKRAPRPQPK